MKFFTVLFFFIVVPIDTTVSFAETKKVLSSSKSLVSYRSISSEDINQQLKNYFQSLDKNTCENSEANIEKKLLGFVEHLNQLKQYILNLKRDFELVFEDRRLLNAILGQIRDLPYEEITKESTTVGKKVSTMKDIFERNYWSTYTKRVPFAWWAQSIVKSLSCLSEGH